MYYLIYSSEAAIEFKDEDLKQLLFKSQENNGLNGITGMLYFFNSIFIQLIEGEEQAVKKLYVTIRKDIRHKDVMTIKESTTEKRFFNAWSMGFKSILPEDAKTVKYFNEVNKKSNQNSTATMDLFKLMMGK